MGTHRPAALTPHSYHEDTLAIRNDFLTNLGGLRAKVRAPDDSKFDNAINNECKAYSVLLVTNEARRPVD